MNAADIAHAYDLPVELVATYVPVPDWILEEERVMRHAVQRHVVDTITAGRLGEVYPYPTAVELVEHDGRVEWDHPFYDDDEDEEDW